MYTLTVDLPTTNDLHAIHVLLPTMRSGFAPLLFSYVRLNKKTSVLSHSLHAILSFPRVSLVGFQRRSRTVSARARHIRHGFVRGL